MENTENVTTFSNLQVLNLLVKRLLGALIRYFYSYQFNRCCNGFALSTADNGCQEHYEPAGDLCIRASIFPETYENAQSRCQSDGGYLLSITTSEIQVINGEKFLNIININFCRNCNLFLNAIFTIS